MSLQIFDQLEQGSDEWLEARRGVLTASVIGQFITPKTIKVAANDKTRSMQYQLVAERITGHVEDRYVSAEMDMGHFIEPLAKAVYAEHRGVEVAEVGFMVRAEFGYRLGYSPDGLVGDDGLIEVKMHIPKLQLATILNGEVPAEHMAQCQAGLLVSGRKWLDYISYSGGMPMWIKRVLPDVAWFDAIQSAAEQFEDTATEMIVAYETLTVGLPETERVLPYEEIVI